MTDGEIGQSTDDTYQPHWEEDRVTLSIVRSIIEAHPDYTITSHIGPDGHRYTMIQFFDEKPNHQANSEFVSFVSGLEGRSTDTETEQGGSDR